MTTTNSSQILLALLLEAGGLVVVTAVAGINDKVANLVLIVIVGLWILWFINHQATSKALNNFAIGIEKAA